MNHSANHSARRVGVAAIVALALSLAACGGSTTTNSEAATPSPTFTESAPTTTVPGVTLPPAPADPTAAVAWEALMSPDGEYAASAAYQAVIATFGAVEPYVSIQSAEERHISALTRQLERMGVEVPPNPYVGKIPAPSDLEASANAEATAEVDNVAMYDRLLATVNGDTALTRVLENLRRASQDMHLPAFRAAAENGGQLTKDQMAAFGLR